MTKNEIKYLKSLSRKKNRLENKQFLIEGNRIVNELLSSSYTVEKIWASKNLIVNVSFSIITSPTPYVLEK